MRTSKAMKWLFLLILCPMAIAQKAGFAVYDGTIYKNKPNLSSYGIKGITIVYAGAMWTKADDHDKPPSPDVLRRLGQKATTDIAVLDIEHWPLTGDPASVSASVAKYLQTLKLFKQQNPQLKIGFYGVAPQRNYWDAIGQPNSPKQATWKATNDSVASIAQLSDILFPSVYTFYRDEEGWQRYAIAQIQEARRIGGGKPVYIFLWPQLHAGDVGGDYLNSDFWRMELETAKNHADGVVIWGGVNQTWDPTAPWWIETQNFLKNLQAGR